MNLAPLRQRNFSLLWWAGLISIAGNWALNIALPFYVLQLTHEPAAVAAVVAAGLCGNVLFGSFAGAYVDRWDRRRIVVTVNVLQTVVLLPLVLVDSYRLVWVVVIVAFTESALTQFFQPAENALLPRLVSAEHLTSANSLNSLNNNIGRLIGPAFGGLAAATLGLGGAALLDAGTFAVAAVLCVLITGGYRADRSDEPERHLLHELAEGLRATGRDRIVRSIFILIAITSIGEGMMSTLFAVYVTGALHFGGREMGWLMSGQAVGGILGSLVAARVSARFRPVPLIASSFAFFGLVDIAIFNYPRFGTSLWPVLGMFVVVGLPVGIHVPALWTLFQIQMPDRLRGRVFAAIWLGAALAGILGAAIAGFLGQRVSVINLLTVQGAGCVVGGVLFQLLAGPGPDSLVERAELVERGEPVARVEPVEPMAGSPSPVRDATRLEQPATS
jgi:MFS family permease